MDGGAEEGAAAPVIPREGVGAVSKLLDVDLQDVGQRRQVLPTGGGKLRTVGYFAAILGGGRFGRFARLMTSPTVQNDGGKAVTTRASTTREQTSNMVVNPPRDRPRPSVC